MVRYFQQFSQSWDDGVISLYMIHYIFPPNRVNQRPCQSLLGEKRDSISSLKSKYEAGMMRRQKQPNGEGNKGLRCDLRLVV